MVEQFQGLELCPNCYSASLEFLSGADGTTVACHTCDWDGSGNSAANHAVSPERGIRRPSPEYGQAKDLAA